mgnify:FL=1|tara:strand:- start:602 stop:1099 length:498 start_codon:yes stop_codon:yes gene_type:complete
MSKNELQTLFDNTPAKSYKDKITQIEEYLVSVADGVDVVVGGGNELIYPDMWEYKHSFADGIYIREMGMKQGQLGFSAIHKHSYGFFLLSGVLASSKEEGVEEFIAPCYIVSPRGAKRVVYAIEDCVITTVHANPTNTQDLKKIEQINVVFSWQDYEEYLKENKL